MRLFDDSADLLDEEGGCGDNNDELGGCAINVSLFTLVLEAELGVLRVFDGEDVGDDSITGEGKEGEGEENEGVIGDGSDEGKDTVDGGKELDGGRSTVIG